MSGPRSVEDLFAAARDDAPPSAVRDAVWGRVATSTVAAAAAPAAATTVAASVAAKAAVVPATTKLLAFGAMIGAAGAAATIVAVGFASGAGSARSTTTTRAARTPAVLASGPTAGARLAVEAPRPRTAPSALLVPPPSPPSSAGAAADESSSLAEEARLVTGARSALIGGEPERALALVRGSHTLPVRALEPEELTLEARSLRALGRIEEAQAAEATLRRRFPSYAPWR